MEVKRSYKGLKYNSQELVSSFLKNKKKFPFILDRESEKELRINLTKDGAVITQEKMKGPGGLPVGSSGKCIVLISGGIDSPVASIFAMKRGLAPIYLHVHAFPKNDSAQKSKMKEEISLLKEYYVNSKSYFIPSYLFQAATLKTPKEYELVLFKKFLYKLAEKVGGEEKADVIVTGESLGQVASQTVKNLIASEKDISLLVVRPLITFDKQEIINEAKRLGTYEISIKKYPDVCSFRAENPSTGAKEEFINKLYKQCKLDNIVKNSIKKASVS